MTPPETRYDLKDLIHSSRLLAEMIRGITLVLDPDGRVIHCSSALAGNAGLSSVDMEGHLLSDIITPADPERPVEPLLAEILQQDTVQNCRTRFRSRPDDSPVMSWNFRRMTASGQDRGIHILGVGQDMTDRIANEARLLRERSALMDRNRDLTCLYGISQITGNPELSFSEKMERVALFLPQTFRYPGQAAACIRFEDALYTSPGFDVGITGPACTERILLNGESRGTITVAYPEEMETAGTSWTFSRTEESLLRTVARQLSMVLEKKEADERKTVLEAQLRHADRLAKVGQLAAGIAHELNNPLGNILGFAQLAAKCPGLPPRAAGDLENIVKSSLYAREIIRKLMIFSRQMPPVRKPVNLNTLVTEGLYFIEHLCEKGGVTVERVLDEKMTDIIADPSQLHQVLVNLVVNAVHAMPDGGTLTIRTGSTEDTVWISVADTGTGMDPDLQRQIFLPFFTTRDVDQGTGLGLSVVHGIVEAHDGTVGVESEQGKGSVFTVELPK